MGVYTIIRNSDGLIVNKIVLDNPQNYIQNPNYQLIQGDVGEIGYNYQNNQVIKPSDIQNLETQIQGILTQIQTATGTTLQQLQTQLQQLFTQLQQLKQQHYNNATQVFHDFLKGA